MRHHQISLTALAVCLLAPTPVFAQTDPVPANVAQDAAVPPPPTTTAATTPETAAANGGLQDIVVTARRTSESLQTVPVAVTALSGDFLDRQNVQDVTSVPQFTPNLSILQQSTSVTAASVYIRGIGNQEPSSAAEQGVGVYLDGVYVARSAGALFDLVDLERIEVLRGPQGTLFGRNTVGGAIQLVSKKPSNDFHVEAKAGYGRYNEWFVRGRVDTGYIGGSVIKASIAGLHKQRNGYVNNLLTPSKRDPGAQNGDAITANVQADFDAVTVNYNFDYNDRRGTAPFFQVIVASPDFVNYYNASPAFGGDPLQISRDRLDDVKQAGFVDRKGRLRYDARAKIEGHALTVALEPVDGLTVKSITAYRKFFQDTILTLGGQGNTRGVLLDPVTFAPSIGATTPYNGNNAPQKQHQFSQELQALGTVGEISYVAGLYYFYENASESNNQQLTFILPGGQAGLNLTPLQAFGSTSESAAAFGQVSWKPVALDEKMELTGGIRYTADRKTILLAGDVQPNLRGAVDFDNVSWLASANYRFTPAIMAYARVSTGYRSGGFNPRASTLNSFDPEKATAYEIGLKSELFDRKLRLNLAAFQTDYDDLQINQFASGTGGATSLVVNAGKVVFRGFEAEMTAAPTDNLTFDGSVGYTQPKFKSFLYRDPANNQVVDVADEAHMNMVAKFQAHAGAQYSADVGMGNLTGRVDYAYRSQIIFYPLDRTSPFNHDIRSRPDHNLKARLSLSDVKVGGSTMEFGIWGDNLTNQTNIDFAIDFGGLGYGAASFKRPRTYGVDAKVSF
ncbi:TonB-dependent receptor [Sphingomonas jatrophae]|uniref:Iron complex outermembrane recepter protein n=1 Tax=Sphingomonas jatrophae TaxID=1166337 RepID=A0A1I6KKL2_9SPHN|nr:TonB-dependent receptor [Sphingomonas jatrophae]SFR91741.1 iron complex outermembrane recepter protein [Sphingomonas jatrophae]